MIRYIDIINKLNILLDFEDEVITTIYKHKSEEEIIKAREERNKELKEFLLVVEDYKEGKWYDY